jgi:hypothetical protein
MGYHRSYRETPLASLTSTKLEVSVNGRVKSNPLAAPEFEISIRINMIRWTRIAIRFDTGQLNNEKPLFPPFFCLTECLVKPLKYYARFGEASGHHPPSETGREEPIRNVFDPSRLADFLQAAFKDQLAEKNANKNFLK